MLPCGGERAAVSGASRDPPAVGVEQDVGRELAGDEEAEVREKNICQVKLYGTRAGGIWL